MTRHDLLRRHMADLGLTDHALATALAMDVRAVRLVLTGATWFDEGTERRLSAYLETPKTEWEVYG